MKNLENRKKNQIQVNIIYKYYLYIGLNDSTIPKDKSINGKSIFSLINLSFQFDNNDGDKIHGKLPKNPYITKDHVPELEKIDKNTIINNKKNMTLNIILIR